MMVKYKVSDIAKDFGVQSKEIISILSNHIEDTKKTGSALNEAELDIVFDVMTQNNQVENFDSYFKSGEGAKKQGEAQSEKERKLMDQLAILEQLKAAQQAEVEAKAKEKADAEKVAKKAENKPTKAENPAQKAAHKPAEKAPAAKKPADKAPVKQEEKPAHEPVEIIMKKKEKVGGAAPNRGPATIRRVDTRASNVDIDKYNEKYERIAPDNVMRDNIQRKQKIKQKSQDYRRPQGSKRETEADKMRRMQLERIKKTPITITIGDEMTVGELAAAMKKTAAEVIKELMKLGIMASITQTIDYDTAELIATEMGCKVQKAVVVTIEERIMDDTQDTAESFEPLITSESVTPIMARGIVPRIINGWTRFSN